MRQYAWVALLLGLVASVCSIRLAVGQEGGTWAEGATPSIHLHPARVQTASGTGARASLEGQSASPIKENLSALPGPGEPSLTPSFGSQRVLDSCWSSSDLAGSSGEKRVIRPAPSPYRDPPTRTSPVTKHPPLADSLRNSIRAVRAPAGRKVVALTFDLCETTKEIAGYDAQVVGYLRAHNVKATFFAGGKWMHSHPERTMQLMADPLFEVGSHAWTHGNFRLLGAQQMEQQVLWTQAQYELLREELMGRPCSRSAGAGEMERIPKVPLVFRFPYGTCSSLALSKLAEFGLPAIQWSVVTGDAARTQTASAIARVVLDQVRSGAIIIAHANGRGHNTANALPLFIPQLKRDGYELVTVSELLTLGPAVTSNECFENTPGDNARYDRLFGIGTE